MWNKLQGRLENHKPTRNLLPKLIPLIIFLTLFLIRISMGMADPTSPPPHLT